MPDEATDHRESVAHMLSEFLRELAALILVFVPLDYLLKGDHLAPNFWSETFGVAVMSGVLFIVRVVLERKAK
jgi:hypothetical protein